MNYQRDSAQKFRQQLRTTTDNSSGGGVFTELTYYILGLRSSIYNVFIAPFNGVRNGTAYTQGNLVVTSADTSQTELSLLNGRLLVNCPAEESYTVDSNGHLICVTIPKI